MFRTALPAAQRPNSKMASPHTNMGEKRLFRLSSYRPLRVLWTAVNLDFPATFQFGFPCYLPSTEVLGSAAWWHAQQTSAGYAIKRLIAHPQKKTNVSIPHPYPLISIDINPLQPADGQKKRESQRDTNLGASSTPSSSSPDHLVDRKLRLRGEVGVEHGSDVQAQKDQRRCGQRQLP